MLSEKESTRLSKMLSLVLRHRPEKIGLRLDKNGWAFTQELLEKLQQHGVALSRQALQHIVETNNKKRFVFSEDGTQIRANQGHSIAIDLKLVPQIPPAILYHGTAERFLSSILEQGILKQKRHHVHLSSNIETAFSVGKRHGKPVVLQVAAGNMHAAGISFYLSDNGVWLTDHVPAIYLREL